MKKTLRAPGARWRAAAAGALASALWLAPLAAEACPVCLGAEQESVRSAFFFGALGLSALPLAIVGGLVWWLRRRARALAGGERRAAAAPAAAGSP